MNKLLALSLCALLTVSGVSAKKVLDHSSFDDWKSVNISALSRSGEWAAFVVNPQEGDGTLYLRNTKTNREIAIPRGYNPSFTADSRWAVAKIKPFYQATRKARIAKKKGLQLPQDSLVIIELKTGKIEKEPGVLSYRLGKNGSQWLAYSSVDTALIKPKILKDSKAGKPLVVRNLNTGARKIVKGVTSYSISDDGLKIGAVTKKAKGDSTLIDGVGVMILPDTTFVMLASRQPFFSTPVFNESATRLAYTASKDSAETGTRKAELFIAELSNPAGTLRQLESEKFRYAEGVSPKEPLYFNQYTTPRFSKSGNRLIAGVAPSVAPNDTSIVPFEVAGLDIWRWDAPMTPPQENHSVDRLRRHTMPVVFDLNKGGEGMLLTANPLVNIRFTRDADEQYALVADPSEKIVSQQWDYEAPSQVSVVNLETGKLIPVVNLAAMSVRLSPDARYVYWYADRNYYACNIATGKTLCISEGVEVPLWDEDQDTPGNRSPYGQAGIVEGNKGLLVYDKYDIWSLDPEGKAAPLNITAGEGRKTGRRFRYLPTDNEQQFVRPGQSMLLSVFDYADKRNGLATTTFGKAAAPLIRNLETYQFTQMNKAKNADVYAYLKANFNTSPDVYIASGNNFAAAKRVSDINPQMKDYNWGTAELVKWYTYNGRPTEGVLYKPEDFDPDKKYPMLVVFYETNSENLYKYYNMEPSWSWVNYPFYVSRGYVILVPDIHYTPGTPGESAYDYICSGVEDLCKKNSWIDKERIGIDGQSWGGYQTAFLVTRTNMFACAGSGAPVANMTSAFGGIRWESGSSRQGQYEQGQSRIGRNLWEAPEFYISNSPIFHADRVNTPLLIMHNDADGAVPWYQGIEMFMALRRLQKPVWMLQYNGEAHNLRERRNRKDITKRLQQFFDHYLKGDPMPRWMKDGIPAIRKGQEWGTELVVTEN